MCLLLICFATATGCKKYKCTEITGTATVTRPGNGGPPTIAVGGSIKCVHKATGDNQGMPPDGAPTMGVDGYFNTQDLADWVRQPSYGEGASYCSYDSQGPGFIIDLPNQFSPDQSQAVPFTISGYNEYGTFVSRVIWTYCDLYRSGCYDGVGNNTRPIAYTPYDSGELEAFLRSVGQKLGDIHLDTALPIMDFSGGGCSPLLSLRFHASNGVQNFGWIPVDVPCHNPIDDTFYFVQEHYRDFLLREPDQSGLNFWAGQITQCGGDSGCVANKRVDVSLSFWYSGEFLNNHPGLRNPPGVYPDFNNGEFVAWCYRIYLQREPDDSGYQFWLNDLNQNNDYSHIIRAFLSSSEYRARYGNP